QMFVINWGALRRLGEQRSTAAHDAARVLETLAEPAGGGWSAPFRLINGGADLMVVHFRESLEALAEAELKLRTSAAGPLLSVDYEYLSVTEAGLYHATADAA